MKFDDNILITGASGLLGTAIVDELINQGFKNIFKPSSKELDLLNESDVLRFFEENKPIFVFHLASLVYGLKGNLDNQLKSIHQNTLMNLNVLNACGLCGVKKIFFAGTVASYSYPYKVLPLKEEEFLTGEPHSGEYGYAISKRHALSYLKILQETKKIDYCYGIFTNMYGTNDKFDIDGGHVIPSLIMKASLAIKSDERILEVWGNENTVRDFLNSKDAAIAAILCMKKFNGYINISSAEETTMGNLVKIINKVFDNKLVINWNSHAPVGIANRVVDNKKLKELGFEKQYSLSDGIEMTVNWFYKNISSVRY